MKLEFRSKVKLLLIPLFLLLCYGVTRVILPKDITSVMYDKQSEQAISEYEQQAHSQQNQTLAKGEDKTKGASIEKPQSCIIKGNINKDKKKRYMLPGCPAYDVADIEKLQGEVWFCTEEEATHSGWLKDERCN